MMQNDAFTWIFSGIFGLLCMILWEKLTSLEARLDAIESTTTVEHEQNHNKPPWPPAYLPPVKDIKGV